MNAKVARHTLTTALTVLLLSACQRYVAVAPAIVDPALCKSGVPAELALVIDGDTIDVLLQDGQRERVRYIGINTAEQQQGCYHEARLHNQQLLAEGPLRLIRDHSDRDRYGRLLRYVCTGNSLFVNAQLVADGMASAARFPPDTRYAQLFARLQRQARKAAYGCLNQQD